MVGIKNQSLFLCKIQQTRNVRVVSGKPEFFEAHIRWGIWDVGKIEAASLNLMTEGGTYCEVINNGKTSRLGNKVLREGYKKVDQVPCPQSSGGFSSTPVLSFLSSINAQWPTSVFNDSQSQPTGIMWTKSFHLLKNPLQKHEDAVARDIFVVGNP